MSKLHKYITFSILIALVSISMAACGGATTENKPANSTANTAQTNKSASENKAEEPKKEEPKAEANKTAEEPKKEEGKETASAEKIGVAECDEYIQKLEICLKDKVPATSRAVFEDAMKQNRDAWKTAAASPQGKAALASGCKQALDMAKTSMASFNCTW